MDKQETDTHRSSQAEHEVQGRLLLDVVVGQGAALLELLAGEDESLLVGRDTLLVLDLGLDGLDSVGGVHVESDGLAGQGLRQGTARRGEARSAGVQVHNTQSVIESHSTNEQGTRRH